MYAEDRADQIGGGVFLIGLVLLVLGLMMVFGYGQRHEHDEKPQRQEIV